jgi:hypothetical protein
LSESMVVLAESTVVLEVIGTFVQRKYDAEVNYFCFGFFCFYFFFVIADVVEHLVVV